jgi:hypothetical protein
MVVRLGSGFLTRLVDVRVDYCSGRGSDGICRRSIDDHPAQRELDAILLEGFLDATEHLTPQYELLARFAG